MTTERKARRAAPPLCAAALAVAAGCTEAPAPSAPVEPGSKSAGSPPPKELPRGVRVGPGRAEVQ